MAGLKILIILQTTRGNKNMPSNLIEEKPLGRNTYVLPVRRPLARPARRREERMATKEFAQSPTTTQERMLGTAEEINNFLCPNLCWRNPPATAKMIGGISCIIPITASRTESSASSGSLTSSL